MSADVELYERIAVLETTQTQHGKLLEKIDTNVQALLQSKWKREGRQSGIAAVISAVIAFATTILAR